MGIGEIWLDEEDGVVLACGVVLVCAELPHPASRRSRIHGPVHVV
jgi:hypothetical protein